MESAALQFPWRQLGELLVAEELLTEDELEQALAEQATTGRLLGQIIVSNGYLSAFSLARVLSEQHGVQLSPREGTPAPPTLVPDQGWRPLGKLLVDLEFLTESQLERALRTLERRGVADVEADALRLELAAGVARFLHAVLGEVDILPAGEQVGQVPFALAMAHEHKQAVSHWSIPLSLFTCIATHLHCVRCPSAPARRPSSRAPAPCRAPRAPP